MEKRLSPAALKLWNKVLIFVAVLTLLATQTLWAVDTSTAAWLTSGQIILYILIFIYMKLLWQSYRIVYDDMAITLDRGVWWRNRTLVPLSRVTNIDILQGPWQRLSGLATLSIQTAGTGQPTAEMRLPSLDAYAELRDDLLRKVLIAQNRSIVPKEEGIPENKRIIQLLEMIENNTRQR